tara:strand:- start:377 stop:589 length:213 start_codon:yes stop_codon:yes gene_type:complete
MKKNNKNNVNKNQNQYVKGEGFDKALNSQNNFWGLGEEVFNKLTLGDSVEVNENDAWVKSLIKDKLIVKT